MAGMYDAVLVKQGGKLVHAEGNSYKTFVAELKEGTKVHLYMDANEQNSTRPQLPKIHKCIRELATQTGESFEAMKLVVKKKSGLLFSSNIKGSESITEISFSDCTRADINLAIQACIEIGDAVGINLR